MKNKTLRTVTFTVCLAAVSSVFGAETARPASQAFKGYPSPEGEIDIRSGFVNPPDGYGNVPFFWWSGDSLDIERLSAQLELLSDSPTDGFAVSYNHTHALVDTAVNAAGHGFCGVADYGKPRAFSDGWWKIWNEFSALCGEKGMGVGMDDYVFAWPGNHDFMDDVRNAPEVASYLGKLRADTVRRGEENMRNIVVSCPVGEDSVMVVYAVPSPELHPALGQRLVERYFQQFEERMDEKGRAGMNYFFQDELDYTPSVTSWCEDMPEQFLARKGYDIVPHLPALFGDRGEESVRTRLDYAEVVTELAEERFFKPIYDWHAERGLIYGCDNMGRGLNPVEYMDYFRAVSWFTAPGNDAPARGSSFMQTKVSSSIAHLYGRPRTWLEAFHSMGWDANGAVLTHQLDHHIIAGGNLLCLHGLYYSTHGGWWEWAPPSFHFRMPYWPHLKKWLGYAERLCFLLSQGRHVCDVAILYPTETMQAYPEESFDFCRAVADTLSKSGYDFDFIDYKSLQNASCADAMMSVAGEKYKVLVLAGIKAMHKETAAAVERFREAGGVVISLDSDPGRAVDAMKGCIVPDFAAGRGCGRVLHRHIAENDVYMVMDVEKGDSVFFRAHGYAERWDAMNGTFHSLPVVKCDSEGTWVRFEGETGSSMLAVFSPGEPDFEVSGQEDAGESVILPLAGDWDVTVVPTMNNRWGDFRLPAGDDFIGVEARAMRCECLGKRDTVDFGESVCGYGPYMMTSEGDDMSWKPYGWSWQYGVYDSPGSQGYHGLKGRVDDGFLILGRGCDQYFRTFVHAPASGRYRVVQEGVKPSVMRIDGKEVSVDVLKLRAGWHELYLKYEDTSKVEYSLEKLECYTIDPRKRSMVMLYPADSPVPRPGDAYGKIVASKWHGTDFLEFDVTQGISGRRVWRYAFETAPGTRSMRTVVNGKVTGVEIDGQEVAFSQKGDSVEVVIAEGNPYVSSVTVFGEPLPGCPGAAFFKSPVKMECAGGRMHAGDWTTQGAMRFFSGGVRYSKSFTVDDPSGRWILDLGEVDATCEVTVNGRKVDVLLTEPYAVDVSDWLQRGMNSVEVLVYSSLANHYQTIPTPYRGTPHAGLCGPVKLRHFTH